MCHASQFLRGALYCYRIPDCYRRRVPNCVPKILTRGCTGNGATVYLFLRYQ